MDYPYLPSIFLPPLKQPFPLFRLVNAWILGSRNRANRSSSCWGTPSSRYLADAAACAVFFSCRSSVAAPFCRAAPCCLAACSVIVPGPWPAAALLTVQPLFLLLAAADAQHKRLHLLRCHSHSFPVRTGLGEHCIQLFLTAVEALAQLLFPHILCCSCIRRLRFSACSLPLAFAISQAPGSPAAPVPHAFPARLWFWPAARCPPHRGSTRKCSLPGR